MQALIQLAQEFSAPMAYLAKIAIAAKHAPKEIYASMHDPEMMAEAYKDAHIAAQQLQDLGHGHIISCMMEAIEAASWQLSPSSDPEEHQAMLLDIFQEMIEIEIEEDAEEAPAEGQGLEWQKAMLDKCLAASAG